MTRDTFVQEAADLLIGRMCLDYTLHETGAKAKAAADLIGIMKTLDYSGDLKATQQMLDAVKAYCEAYDIPWDMGLIRGAVEFFLTVSLPLLKESFKTTGNWGDIAKTTDLVGNYLITVLQYANMQTDAMKTMRGYLPPTGDLYWEIERRLDMIENGQIGMYLAREAQKLILDQVGGMLADAVKNAAGSTVMGQLGSYKALMEVMGAAYGRLTGRADAGKHVQVLLLTCFAQEMTNAHAQVCQELLINGATAQEKQDLRTMYEAKRSAWCILLETAAELRTDDDDTYHHDECLVWRDRIEQECGFADYIRAAKRAAPSQAVYSMRAPARRSSAQSTQYDVQYGVLKGYRFLDGAWEDGAAVLLDQKNTEAALYVTQELAGSVGENAFAGENGLRVVTLADGVGVEAGAFASCENLTMVVLEGEHEIELDAFKKGRLRQNGHGAGACGAAVCRIPRPFAAGQGTGLYRHSQRRAAGADAGPVRHRADGGRRGDLTGGLLRALPGGGWRGRDQNSLSGRGGLHPADGEPARGAERADLGGHARGGKRRCAAVFWHGDGRHRVCGGV